MSTSTRSERAVTERREETAASCQLSAQIWNSMWPTWAYPAISFGRSSVVLKQLHVSCNNIKRKWNHFIGLAFFGEIWRQIIIIIIFGLFIFGACTLIGMICTHILALLLSSTYSLCNCFFLVKVNANTFKCTQPHSKTRLYFQDSLSGWLY